MVLGFAMIAYPAVYGTSGVMTFIVNQEGVIYEKNLGPDTSKLAGAVTVFNPDPQWKRLNSIWRGACEVPEREASGLPLYWSTDI